MGYGLIFSRFLEEDQIPWAEVRFLHALSEIPLPHGVIWHLHPLAENQASKAGAVLRLVSDARERRRVLVGCTEVTPRSFEHLRFHGGLTREHPPPASGGYVAGSLLPESEVSSPDCGAAWVPATTITASAIIRPSDSERPETCTEKRLPAFILKAPSLSQTPPSLRWLTSTF